MIYILLIILLVLYFYFLLTNVSNDEKVNISNLSKFFIIILFIIPFYFIYMSKSGIQDITEYERILKKNENIRVNIAKIKKSIPKLERKLQNEPSFYDGWVMLARSYSIIDDLKSSINSYEIAFTLDNTDIKVLKEYLIALRTDDSKKNKEKIIGVYSALLMLDKDDPSILLNKLHYSVKINEPQLTIKTLNEIIDHPKIIDKERYRKILTKISNTQLKNE